MTPFGWQAKFTEEWLRGGMRLHLWQQHDGGRISVARAEVLLTTIEEHEVEPEGSGLYLPRDAYDAIVAAIDPAPHRAEIGRLEEALAVERLRVDNALQLLWRQS